jgi:hypothetical protein
MGERPAGRGPAVGLCAVLTAVVHGVDIDLHNRRFHVGEQSSPSTNKGDDSALKVTSKSGNSNVRTLVGFSLPTDVPAGCAVQSATLRLHAGSAVDGRTLQVLRASAAWTEGGVTWSNQPSTTGTAATVASGLGWREGNVTAIVQAQAAGANHGFVVRDPTEGSAASPEQSFASRENGSDQPQLVVTYTPAG